MPLHEPLFETIKSSFLECLNNIMDGNDRYLLQHRVHERTIVARLSCFLSSIEHFNEYDIDCEYNRSWETPKWFDMQWVNRIKIPDLIIHKRWEYIHDLLYCEFKLWNKWATKQNKLIKTDIARIEKFMTKEPYKYKYWVFVYFSRTPNKSWIIRLKKDEQWNVIHEDTIPL